MSSNEILISGIMECDIVPKIESQTSLEYDATMDFGHYKTLEEVGSYRHYHSTVVNPDVVPATERKVNNQFISHFLFAFMFMFHLQEMRTEGFLCR